MSFTIRFLFVFLIIACTLSSLISQVDPFSRQDTEASESGTGTTYNIINPINQESFDRSKFAFADGDYKYLGRKSYEVIKVDLFKGRPNDTAGQVKSFPFDVPFYIEGEINSNVDEVFVIAVERYNNIFGSLNPVVFIDGKIEQFLKYYPESNLDQIEEAIRHTLNNNTLWKRPDIQIGHWKRPNKNLVKSDSNNVSFSVLIKQLESGKKYDVFFFSKSELTRSKKNEIVNNGIKIIFQNVDQYVKIYNILFSEPPVCESDIDAIEDSNLDKVYSYILDEFEKNGLDTSKLHENYKKSREEFIPEYRKQIRWYIESKRATHLEDERFQVLSKEIFLDVDNIECNYIKDQLKSIFYTNPYLPEFNTLTGRLSKNEILDYVKRQEVIKENIIALDKLNIQCQDFEDCCRNYDRKVVKSLIKKIKRFSHAQLAVLEGNANQRNVFNLFLQEMGTDMLNDIGGNSTLSAISLETDDHFLQRAGELIMPDFGFMYQNSSFYGSQVSPFFGVHLHMVRVNRESKINVLDIFRKKDMCSGYRVLKPFSLTTGFTFLNNYEGEIRRSLISGIPVNMYLGLGVRVSDYGRINIGKVFYREADDNPIRNRTTVQSDAFVSFSVDFYVNEFLGNTFKWLF